MMVDYGRVLLKVGMKQKENTLEGRDDAEGKTILKGGRRTFIEEGMM